EGEVRSQRRDVSGDGCRGEPQVLEGEDEVSKVPAFDLRRFLSSFRAQEKNQTGDIVLIRLERTRRRSALEPQMIDEAREVIAAQNLALADDVIIIGHHSANGESSSCRVRCHQYPAAAMRMPTASQSQPP